MEKLFLLLVLSVIAYAAAGCGTEIEISDSTHTIRHEIALDQIHAEIVAICHDAYGPAVDQQKCIQDTLQSILTVLQQGGVQ